MRNLEPIRIALSREILDLTARGKVELPATPEPGDSIDQAQSLAELDLAASEITRRTARLARLRNALRRLNSPLAGKCTDCEADIPLPRLHAVPDAARCIACQEAFERCGSGSGTRHEAVSLDDPATNLLDAA